jgi:hypothetical protein
VSSNAWTGTFGVANSPPFDTKLGSMPFLRIDFMVAAGAAGSLNQLTIGSDAGWDGANSTGWVVRSIPAFDDKIGSFTNINVNAATVLFSDVSRVLDVNGTVSGAQINMGYDIPGVCVNDLVSLQSLVDGAATQTSRRMNFQTGLYAFLKPEDVSDYSFQTYMKYTMSGGQAVLVNAATPVNLLRSFLAISIAVQVTDGAVVGGTYNRTTNYAVEFQTLDPWYFLTDQTLNSTARSELVDALRECPQFHENPFHLSDIFDFLKNAGKSILGMAPEIADVVSGVFPKTAPILMPTASALRAARGL